MTPGPPGRFAVAGRAVLGWIILCAGIGLAISLARLSAGVTGGSAGVTAVIQAVLAAVLVVPAILVLRSKLDRGTTAALGITRHMAAPAAFGVGVGLISGAMTWLPVWLLGWIRVDRVEVTVLVSFLMINTLVLLLYEALPEELALRGYAWANVRSRWSPFIATLVVTALFVFSSSLISVFQASSARLLNVESGGIGLAPAGSDPVAYVLQLSLFGLALCAARRIPLAGALGIAIGFHLAQLTVTRLLLGGLGWLDSGLAVTFVEPAAIALVLVHICLAGLIFVLARKVLTRRGGWIPGRRLSPQC